MTDIVERLRDTPNWQRQSFEHWKTATSVYDRAPFEAAAEIERLRAERDALLAEAVRYRSLATCTCGDEFTVHDPGTCCNCRYGSPNAG